MPKIVQVIFSTNRLEYLIPTLRYMQNINYYGCEVHRVIIDDYPRTRNNTMFLELCKLYGIDEIILNKENKGLSLNWTDFYKLIAERDYDYIFHLEDDVKIMQPVLVTDLIELLENNSDVSQVQLARQAWYSHEEDPKASSTDFIYKNYRYIKGSLIFSPMASLCPISVARLPIAQEQGCNLNEGIIGQYMFERLNKVSYNVRNYYGGPIINHIGEWFVGRRVLPTEPSYEMFAHYDPNLKYYSRDGRSFP